MHNWVELLKLEKHIEGGYFGRSYTSSDKVIPLNNRYNKQSLITKGESIEEHINKEKTERFAGSSIYFLLEREDFSAWHQLNSDEIWHYYDGGSPVDIYIIGQRGHLTIKTLGNPLLSEYASFQVVINAGDWFAAEIRNKSSFALMGCTVSPGFEYYDFTLADRDTLISQYPEHIFIINKFTRLKTNIPDLLLTDASCKYLPSLSFLSPKTKGQTTNNQPDIPYSNEEAEKVHSTELTSTTINTLVNGI
jgi:uncharacterized protein